MSSALKAQVALIPEEDPNSIGNLAIELGYITLAELREAVQIQQQRLPLGKILIGMGKLTEDQLKDLLLEQAVRRGEITDREAIRRHQRSKMRHKMSQIKTGFRELRDESQRFTQAVFSSAHLMKAK